MKKKLPSVFLRNYFKIYQAAAASNDGQRCMIAPHPLIREQLKKELDEFKKLASESSLGFMLKPRMNTRLGMNDALIFPGNVFPLGTSADRARSSSAANAARAPQTGTLRVIVVMVEFSDKRITTTKRQLQDLFFSTGLIPTGSVNEYFQEVTGGKISIAGEVVGPFLLPKKMSQYAHGESGTGNAIPNARTMAADAARMANASVDFSVYDNDHNGFVDAYIVVHAGRGAEETNNPGDIWSHKWLLPSAFNADGTKIFAYLTVPEDCKLGVCAHELGHLLFGFPDLYDTEIPGEGVGDWCLMGGGSWNNNGLTPAHPCAWCKAEQGWVTVINNSSNKAGVVLDDVKKSKQVYRLWKDGGPGNEYFLIENRQRTRYDKFLPGEGLLIWHVDDAMDNNTNENHYMVSLMQADGKKQLETGANRGDAADSWPGTLNKRNFTRATVPNSLSYGGLETSVQVKNISKVLGGKIKADLFVKAGPALSSKKAAKKVVKKAAPKTAKKAAKKAVYRKPK